MNKNTKYIYEVILAAWESYVEATGRKDFSEFMEFLKVAVERQHE